MLAIAWRCKRRRVGRPAVLARRRGGSSAPVPVGRSAAARGARTDRPLRGGSSAPVPAGRSAAACRCPYRSVVPLRLAGPVPVGRSAAARRCPRPTAALRWSVGARTGRPFHGIPPCGLHPTSSALARNGVRLFRPAVVEVFFGRHSLYGPVRMDGDCRSIRSNESRNRYSCSRGPFTIVTNSSVVIRLDLPYFLLIWGK